MTNEFIGEFEYKSLLELCQKNEAFYHVDQVLHGHYFRIFGNRLPSMGDWKCHPLARWCRGLMFEVTQSGDFIRVACRPFKKFPNYGEWDTLETIKFEDGVTYECAAKMDGSLLSTFLVDGELCLKSKMSLHSDQVKWATDYINRHSVFKDELLWLTKMDHTVDMEYCALQNRIVLAYPQETMKVLAARKNSDGEECTYEELYGNFVGLDVVDTIFVNNIFIESIPNMIGIEGYVIKVGNERVKLKSTAYVIAHNAKNNISSPKKIVEAVLNEALDDVKGIFHDDAVLMGILNHVESETQKVYHGIHKTCLEFYQNNKDKSRKDYAIEAIKTDCLGLLMNLYLGKEPDYNSYIMKNYDKIFAGKFDNVSVNGTG